ncbi:protein SLOW GREEN 1, chloroplastic-like [Cucurbita moschata]|uniref:Protein SLOW GREEN 1, chloroplastic-like n=1 Tax=Cucurbita moschata TaxID=3662 RepID=A0A6J1HFV1_CUCMO|nr:protein SLOW GREEN 1, chloroplastic-like [Cucurbita moschata]
MEGLATFHHRPLPSQQHLSFSRRLPSFSYPSSSLFFLSPPPSRLRSPLSFRSLSVKASSSPSTSDETSRNAKPSISETTNDGLLSGFLRTACISVAAAAFFFLRFDHRRAVVVAAPVAPEMTESIEESNPYEENESVVEEQPMDNSNDVEALRSLVEENVKSGKLPEAIEALNRLIEIEPNELELPLLRANFHSYMGELELAKSEFEEILMEDPLRVEAYHGLALVSEQLNDNSLKGVAKRIEQAMEKCKKQNKKSDIRDFKLLIAQIKVMEGSYFDALKAYQELVREEPRDFRPYLCQGIIYSLLRKNEEAEKQFEKFRRLVPKNHPYREYFDENVFATKLFGQKLEKEGAGLKS